MFASLCRRVYIVFLCDGCCGKVERWLSMSPLEIAPLLDFGGLCCDEWETARMAHVLAVLSASRMPISSVLLSARRTSMG
jgi:hypothetical protein